MVEKNQVQETPVLATCLTRSLSTHAQRGSSPGVNAHALEGRGVRVRGTLPIPRRSIGFSVNGVLPDNGHCDLPNPQLENERWSVPGDGLVNGLQQLDSNLSQDEPCSFERLLNLENYKAPIRLGDKNRRTLNPSSPICNKEKRFNCDYCERKFFRKEHLTMHLRTHTGEKPFACEVCGRAFAEKWNLKEHRRTHTGIRPYPCRFCGKAFYRSSHLKVHVRRHTGEKPYKCDNCHQTFVDSSSLQKHRRFPSVCCKLENAIFVNTQGVEAMERQVPRSCDEANIDNRQLNPSGNKGNNLVVNLMI
ncbi:zinc finger protein 431-like [Rhincodon typus]|uniref:zinc finger protein 431-like n=1 Tax=Rhincodon typus TaxID=259920 RepID=UPI00202E81B3|nr:zinc finger protein 431-like [Rhincodon typus]